MRFLSLRALFLLGFVIAMPVLALPPVARWLDERLYGPPPTDFGRPPAAASGEPSPPPPLAAETVAPAGFIHEPSAASPVARGLESADDRPPPLAPAPSFAPLVAPPPVAAQVEHPIDEGTLARLIAIRQRLETLGAEYIIVETQDGSGRYCFRCRMLVEPQSRLTRAFEATAVEPIAAAEEVLRQVEVWRTAAAPVQPRQTY
jgi:hypothetical protein